MQILLTESLIQQKISVKYRYRKHMIVISESRKYLKFSMKKVYLETLDYNNQSDIFRIKRNIFYTKYNRQSFFHQDIKQF